jgi:hypothetical protein
MLDESWGDVYYSSVRAADKKGVMLNAWYRESGVAKLRGMYYNFYMISYILISR